MPALTKPSVNEGSTGKSQTVQTEVSPAGVPMDQSSTTEITLQWKAKLTPLLLEIRKVFKGLFSTQEARIFSLTFQELQFYFYKSF